MKFEKGLDDICANCRYDVKFNNKQNPNLPLFEEFKSYNSETWSKIANDKGFIQQFKSYLQKVNKIEQPAIGFVKKTPYNTANIQRSLNFFTV